MDRYKKVEKPRAETPIDENEIRITSQGRMRSYITYAMTLLQEKGSDEIVFKAMGRAINKTVTIVELIKRRIAGLHQITSITSTDISDTWEPLEEGLLPLQTTRRVSMITIALSKKELDVSSVGYQPPIPADQVGCRQRYIMKEMALLLVEEEAEVVEGGEGEEYLEMALCQPSMMMEVGIRIGAMEGVEDVAEVAFSVGVEEEDIMAPRWILRKIWEVTIKKNLLGVEAVDVVGELVVGAVNSDLMD